MSVAANRYAKALIDTLYPVRAEAGHDQLLRLNALLEDEPDARRLLENPTVPANRRRALLKEIGDALSFSSEIRNFVAILIDRNRLGILEEIIEAYQKFLDERTGVVRASVTTAQPLDSAARGELTAKLEMVTGKRVRMEVSVDPALLGGIVARVGGTIYDGSLRQQLQSFKARLIQE
jgi:F-type H+-transporting ATPase subunit delta